MKRAMIIRLSSLCLLLSVVAGAKHFDTSSVSLSGEAARDLSGESAVGYLKQAGLFDRVKAYVEASHYEIYRQTGEGAAGTEATHRANNPAQTLQASFTRNGVEIGPSAGSSQQSWQMRMKFAGIGYAQTLSDNSTGSARVNGNRIEIPHSNVTEWYVNKPEGIEQGFTVKERPGIASNGDPLRVALEITGGLRARLEEGGQEAILERNDGTEVVRYDHLAAFDNTGRSLRSWMEAGEGRLSLLVDDSNAEYPLVIDPLFTMLVKVKTVTGSYSTVGNPTGFGNSVAISGNRIVVGAPWDGPDKKGAAYVFDWEAGGNGNWGEVKKLTASDGAAHNWFGESVAISGDTIVVGAPNPDVESSAYIFQRNVTNHWEEVRKLAHKGSSTVGISGNTVVIGGWDVSIFERNEGGNNNWGMVTKLGSDIPLGSWVSISGDTIVVDGWDLGGGYVGYLLVYYRNRGGLNNWGLVKSIYPVFSSNLRHAISNDTIVVGTAFWGYKVQIYGRNHGGADNWGLIKERLASDVVYPGTLPFGASVDISGDTVVVGAYCCTLSLDKQEPGGVYVFRRDEGGVDNWGEVQKLTDPSASDPYYLAFGKAVATNGYTVVAGNYESADIFSTLLSITTMPVSVLPELPPSTIKIAQVFELDHPPQTFSVKVNGKNRASVNGVTVSDIVVDPKGAVTARVGATCGATSASFTLEATNEKGETVTNTLMVTVSDTAPTITLKKRSTEMWPANGRYGTVMVSDMVADVNDQCGTSLNVNDVKIEKVTSDEPDDAPGEADGNTTDDILIGADCQSVRLRSEHDVTKNGRVYSITLLVRDSSGNTVRAVYKVSVPKNEFGTPAVLDGVALIVLSSCR